MADPLPPTPSSDRWKRLAVTLACFAAGIALPHLGVGLPGIDFSAVEALLSRTPGASTFGTTANFGVFALGLMPVLSAMGLVELAAVAIPRLRPLRHGGPEGRAKLSRASGGVALLLALFQGFGIAKLVEALSASAPVVVAPGWGFRLVTMVTLTAGTAVLLVVAQLSSVRGLASGLALIVVGSGVEGTVRPLVREVLLGKATGGKVAAYVAGAALTATVTWIALRDPRPEPAPGDEPPGYRSPPPRPARAPVSIPTPASGAGVLLVAASLVSLVRMVPGLIVALPTGTLASAIVLAVVVLGAVLSAMFNAPHRIAGVLSRARTKGKAVPRDPELERDARRALREATLRNLVFLGAILTIHRLTGDTFGVGIDMALLTALVLDAAAELRARREVPDLVPVWPEHRPYALQAAREALGGAAIPLFARGEKLRRLLQLAGPFVPIDLMVPRADAKRAAKILDRVLRFHPEDEKAGPTEKVAAPWTRRERGLLAAAAALFAVPLVMAAWPEPTPPPRAPVRADALLLLEVNDDDDLFSPEPMDLPRGVSLKIENAPIGPGRTKANHFAQIMASGAADLGASRTRLLAWAEPLAAARGLSVRAGPVGEMDPDTDKLEQIGWRTYLLRGAPILDARDVKHATANPSDDRGPLGAWTVLVALGEPGAERFRSFTAAHIKRRLAIVVDDHVESAPVIQTEIPGGVVSITMGAGALEEQRADAQRLADRLMGR